MPYWYRRVFLLAIPLILSNLTQPLLSTVDTVLSGHLPGAAGKRIKYDQESLHFTLANGIRGLAAVSREGSG